jgi:hypothetical protein
LKASEFQELRELAHELAVACARHPSCAWANETAEAVAPTLARHADPDEYSQRLHADLREWAKQNLPPVERPAATTSSVDLIEPKDQLADICATLLYPVCDRPFRALYEWTSEWNVARRKELLDVALGNRNRRDELPRHFRSQPYAADIVMDIGAYRDLHRHRRCQQFRQSYTNRLGYETPALIATSGATTEYQNALAEVDRAGSLLPQPAAQYSLPFAARSRFLFKMDFAELEYVSRLRSGVKGHFAYRTVAWDLKCALEKLDPYLGSLVSATPPTVQDPLTR